MPEKFNSILLVHDDRTTSHFNKLLLEEMALAPHIQLAYHGQEALSLIKEVLPAPKKNQLRRRPLLFSWIFTCLS